jgi:hypothetical protein
MSVISALPDSSILQLFILSHFPGRDHDYQNLNLTFAVNVLKFGFIISLFPNPLKPCVVSIKVSLFPYH